MKKYLYITLIGLIGASSTIRATPVRLFEAALNIDGAFSSFFGPGSSGDPTSSNVDVSGFNETTGLGTLTVTLENPGTHYVGMYTDMEIDATINTFFNEFGVGGSSVAGQSWEIDEPGFFGNPPGDIYENIIAGTLDNTNGVPAGAEDDVSMALAWEFFLNSGQTAVIDFTVSEVEPTDGDLYLTQTDPDSDHSIYFSSSLSIQLTPVPVGGSNSLMLILGISSLIAIRRFLRGFSYQIT